MFLLNAGTKVIYSVSEKKKIYQKDSASDQKEIVSILPCFSILSSRI